MRRVLVVTYYFPPAGGPGVQRVLKFVRYLRDFGWEPVVLTVRDGAYPERDPTLAQDLPPGLAVYRTAAWDPFDWYARLTGKSAEAAVKVGSLGEPAPTWQEAVARWVRANVFVPDARVGWVPFAAAASRRLLDDAPVDAVLTSGPPHSTHLIGWWLQGRTGLPWVADFRDPWTDINYYHELPHTAWAERLDALLETAVLRRATRVVTVSPTWKDVLQAKVGGASGRFGVVQNGFDAADFEAPPVAADVLAATEIFDVTYVGSLYASRNPEGLWQALAALLQAGRIPKLRLRLVGKLEPAVWASLRTYGLKDLTDRVGYVPHDAAVQHMRNAHLLLLIIEAFRHNEGMITGKLYEYLAAGRPVLGLGPMGGDAAALLEQTEAGRVHSYDDVEAIQSTVAAHYDAWAAGTPRGGATPSAAAPYSRRAQTARLAEVLNATVDVP